MSMTAEERKAWAVERLDAWLRDHEVRTFFDYVGELAESVEHITRCTGQVCGSTEHEDGASDCDDSIPCIDCEEAKGGGRYTRAMSNNVEEIEARAEVLFDVAS